MAAALLAEDLLMPTKSRDRFVVFAVQIIWAAVVASYPRVWEACQAASALATK